MEQLTPGEWAKEQLKRAPSFAIATALVAGLLILSAFIEYSAAKSGRELELLTEANLADELPPPLEDIRDTLLPDIKPDLAEMPKNIPIVPDAQDSPLDAPLDTADVDSPITDDITSDVIQPTDPVPIIKHMAVIATEGSTGGFRGALGNRTEAGKRRAARRFGMSPETMKSINLGLQWLKNAQDKQKGCWTVAEWGGSQREAICGVTGLATLAFLGFGVTDRDPEYGLTVRKAIEFLISKQQTEGPNKGKFANERMYEQGICTIALAEASAMLQNRKLAMEAKAAAQYGLDYILSKQPAHGGFGYTGEGDDMSVTGWQVMAIKSAIVAELRVPKEAKEKCENLFRLCMSKDYGTPYRFSPTGNTTGGTDTMTAVSLACRLMMGRKRSAPDCVGQAEWLTKGDKHLKLAQSANNEYYMYNMCMAMFQMGGKFWDEWNKVFAKSIVARQEVAGPERGSWPVEGSAYGRHGGRVYTTAMALLALEVYFRHLPMYQAF